LDDATFAKCCALDNSVASILVVSPETGLRSNEIAMAEFNPNADFRAQLARRVGAGGWLMVSVRPNDGAQKPFQFGLDCPFAGQVGQAQGAQTGMEQALNLLVIAKQLFVPVAPPQEPQSVLSLLREARMAKNELEQLTGEAKPEVGGGMLETIVKVVVEKAVQMIGNSALPTSAEAAGADGGGMLPDASQPEGGSAAAA